jgi:uncharacterized membrane protein YozB (DUF420 family)
MIEILHQPGFLGTHANFAADMTLALMILIGGLLTLGFYMARRKRYEIHRWIQTTAVILNSILVLWLMVLPFRDFVVRDQGGPRQTFFYVITIIHAAIGAVAFLLGVFITLRANGLMLKPFRFSNYKLFMRTAYVLYLLAILAGIFVYITWFVIIPNPPVY